MNPQKVKITRVEIKQLSFRWTLIMSIRNKLYFRMKEALLKESKNKAPKE